jgi:hypothetical protein
MAGADWDGIYSYHLDSKELKPCISPQALRLSEAHGRRWIAELISLSEDAQTLCVNIGVEKIVSGGGIMHYDLAKVELRDRLSVTQLTSCFNPSSTADP